VCVCVCMLCVRYVCWVMYVWVHLIYELVWRVGGLLSIQMLVLDVQIFQFWQVDLTRIT